MQRRLFVLLISVLGLSAGISRAAVAAPASHGPNILFVLVDDMGYGDLSCFGGDRVQTQHIDRLAREGIRFNQFYVNSPICSPSRVALTTGQYPGRWRITSYLEKREANHRRGIADWLDPAAPSLARFLSQAGYHTAHVGKWHMGGQRDVGDAPTIRRYGFDCSLTNFEGLGERALPLFEPRRDGRPLEHGPTQMSAELGGGPIHWVKRHEVTRVFVDRALKEMDVAAESGKPFYINLWLDDVHTPVQAPPQRRGDGSPADHYLGVLKEMDVQLGRLFERIRSQPELSENTIVLLASDNGPEPGFGLTGGLRGHKCNLYEGGIRSPLIVWSSRIPGSAIGSINDKTVLAGIDFAPSLLALAGVPTPAKVDFDGLDMSQALVGEARPDRDRPVMWVRPPDRPGPRDSWPDLAIREGDWKLLVYHDRPRPELFDIRNDPQESKNLTEDHPAIAKRLAEKVIAWDQTIREQGAAR